jgi:hypothetical protein
MEERLVELVQELEVHKALLERLMRSITDR